MNLDTIIKQFDFNLSFAQKLVEDLSVEQLTSSPGPGFENHPAFTLGHLATGSAMMVEDLGGVMEIPTGWSELFIRKGPGDPRHPDPNASRYPSKQELLKELERQHTLVKKIMKTLTLEQWQQPVKWRFSNYLPTMLDLCTFMCIQHEAMHLGQLSAWRRAMKLPSALGSL